MSIVTAKTEQVVTGMGRIEKFVGEEVIQKGDPTLDFSSMTEKEIETYRAQKTARIISITKLQKTLGVARAKELFELRRSFPTGTPPGGGLREGTVHRPGWDGYCKSHFGIGCRDADREIAGWEAIQEAEARLTQKGSGPAPTLSPNGKAPISPADLTTTHLQEIAKAGERAPEVAKVVLTGELTATKRAIRESAASVRAGGPAVPVKPEAEQPAQKPEQPRLEPAQEPVQQVLVADVTEKKEEPKAAPLKRGEEIVDVEPSAPTSLSRRSIPSYDWEYVTSHKEAGEEELHKFFSQKVGLMLKAARSFDAAHSAIQKRLEEEIHKDSDAPGYMHFLITMWKEHRGLDLNAMWQEADHRVSEGARKSRLNWARSHAGFAIKTRGK